MEYKHDTYGNIHITHVNHETLIRLWCCCMYPSEINLKNVKILRYNNDISYSSKYRMQEYYSITVFHKLQRNLTHYKWRKMVSFDIVFWVPKLS